MSDHNEFFVSSSSLAAADRSKYGAYEFNSDTFGNIINGRTIQDAAITNAKIGSAAINDAKIGTLSFNTINGGTATFGGTSNGEGVVSVQNSGGSEVVRLDNTGVTVTNGSLSLQNSSGSVSFDASGLVSLGNFGGAASGS